MVEHLPPSIGLLELAPVVSQVSRKMLVRHALVRAQGDDHLDLRRRRQGLPHSLQQQGNGQVLVPSGTTRQTRWFSRPAPATAVATNSLTCSG
jgi:hypothetical protein